MWEGLQMIHINHHCTESGQALIVFLLSERQDESRMNSKDDQQGASEVPDPAQNQEAQQVCKSTPPLETVADETTNKELRNLSCRSFMVSERLIIEAAGWRKTESESEERERERERAQNQAKCKSERKQRHSDNPSREQRRTMDLDQYDDNQSDSGVSVDFSPNSMSDNETPIEREIRLTFRREQSLRRSRGLDETKEFVEIPIRKPILCQGLTEKPVKDHSKERQFAGKKMQREIHVETEREKALVKLGRLPGFYDKGTVRQLQEKRLLFEAFPESKDLQISSDRTQEPTNRLEMLFQNHSTIQPTKTSPKDLQSSRNYNHGTLKTAQEPKNERTSSVPLSKITNGRNVGMDKPDFSSKIHTKHLGLDSSPQLFPSLKEKKLLFESLQENKDVQISKDQDREVSESFKEQRKSLDIFFQNQNSALKDLQEPKDPQIKRNQDDKISKRNMQVQNSKPCGPGFSEAVDRQVVIIENNRTVSSHTNGQVSTPETVTDSANVRSLTEKSRQNSQVQNQTADGEELKENPFFKLRSLPSRLPDVRRDIQETKRREEDLRKQRMILYGNRSKVTGLQSGTTPTHTVTDTPGQHMNVTSVSSSFGKLDLPGPPQPLQNGHKTQPEVKEQKQTLLLVQRWETGLINAHSDNHHT